MRKRRLKQGVTKSWYNQLALRGAICRKSAFPDLNGPTTLPAWASFSDRIVSIWKMRLRKLVASRSNWVRLNFFMANLRPNYTTMVKPFPLCQSLYQVLALSGSGLSGLSVSIIILSAERLARSGRCCFSRPLPREVLRIYCNIRRPSRCQAQYIFNLYILSTGSKSASRVASAPNRRAWAAIMRSIT